SGGGHGDDVLLEGPGRSDRLDPGGAGAAHSRGAPRAQAVGRRHAAGGAPGGCVALCAGSSRRAARGPSPARAHARRRDRGGAGSLRAPSELERQRAVLHVVEEVAHVLTGVIEPHVTAANRQPQAGPVAPAVEIAAVAGDLVAGTNRVVVPVGVLGADTALVD